MTRRSRAVPYPASPDGLTAKEREALGSWLADENGCWIWLRGRASGYAVLHAHEDRSFQVHRLVYTFANGPVDPTWDVDHLCRVRACVNPAHLEAVPHRENVRRAYDPRFNPARSAA